MNNENIKLILNSNVAYDGCRDFCEAKKALETAYQERLAVKKRRDEIFDEFCKHAELFQKSFEKYNIARCRLIEAFEKELGALSADIVEINKIADITKRNIALRKDHKEGINEFRRAFDVNFIDAF